MEQRGVVGHPELERVGLPEKDRPDGAPAFGDRLRRSREQNEESDERDPPGDVSAIHGVEAGPERVSS